MKLRQPRITLEQKLRIVTDYNTAGMSIDTILKRNHISVGTLYRIIKQTVKA